MMKVSVFMCVTAKHRLARPENRLFLLALSCTDRADVSTPKQYPSSCFGSGDLDENRHSGSRLRERLL
jgi:hypothetical protein